MSLVRPNMLAPAPKPSIRIAHGSGDPAGFPGFKPMNPWGRPMPQAAPKPEAPSHQLFVELPDKRVTPIGPVASEEFLLPLCAAIETNIAAGREKDWRNPHIVRLLGKRG